MTIDDDRDAPEDYYAGPPHPSGELRFVVRFDAYPGGSDAYWRDYRMALSAYARHRHPDVADLAVVGTGEDEGDEYILTAVQGVERAVRQALQRRVFDVSMVVQRLAGIDGRCLATWLVVDCRFPWRSHCSWDDLNRLLAFLLDPQL